MIIIQQEMIKRLQCNIGIILLKEINLRLVNYFMGNINREWTAQNVTIIQSVSIHF